MLKWTKFMFKKIIEKSKTQIIHTALLTFLVALTFNIFFFVKNTAALRVPGLAVSFDADAQINGNQISDVYLFQMKAKGQTKPSVVTAEKGELKALPNGDQVLNLQNTLRVEGTSVLPDFRITHFDDYQAYLGHQETNTESDEAAELSFEQLLKDKSAAAKAELHWRITLILAVPLMALIAVPMSKVNPRQGRFAKILPALLLYLIYFLLQSSFKSAGGAGKLDAGLLMPLVNIAFLILGIVLNSWDSTAMHKFRRVFRKG